MTEEKFELIPPEIEYMSAQYVLAIPVTDRHLNNPWKLRLRAAKLLERKLGDHVQLTALKVKRPGLKARLTAWLHHQVPTARLYVTVKF